MLALGGAGSLIVYIFTTTIRLDQAEDLGASLDRLVVSLSRGDADPAMQLRDPRYSVPAGGLYFQAEDLVSGEVVRSRSLWDAVLATPAPNEDGDLTVSSGPDGQTVAVLVRDVELVSDGGASRRLRAAVAEDVRLRGHSVQAFGMQIALALLVVVIALSAAGWLMVQLGLRPLDRLKVAISDVIGGKRRRLDETVPAEFLPVARQINALLDAQERHLQLSRERADDLAHGLKTPLAVIRATIARLRARGDNENAAGLELLSAEMGDRIDYQMRLAHLRIRSQGQGFVSSVDDALIRSVAVIRKTGRGGELFWHLSTGHASADIDSHDLMELVGVLLENAAQWALSEVYVSSSSADGWAHFEVSDDGPGVSEAQIQMLGERGRRLDETRTGTGIGLAVAKEIVRLNGGSLSFSSNAMGGLKCGVTLRAAS